jgi:(2Fe-2S) ferredoxin
MTDLELHASGFIVRYDGKIDARGRQRFKRFVIARGLAPAPDIDGQLDDALATAIDRYRSRDALLVCGAAPCRNVLPTDDDALAALTTCGGIPVTRTGCQWFCKHKPVVALRLDGQRELFGRTTCEADRQAVAEFARAAAAERSLLAPERSNVEGFHFDPDHADDVATAPLRSVHFLVGRFRGEGRYADGTYSFRKEVVGAYEAGGRFVTLRMEARYPTTDGGTDVHRALVVVGATPESNRLAGRAFTDGGDIHDYAVHCRDAVLVFDDQSPDHGTPWRAVRKLLRPRPDGYDECLEVDRGRGYEPYYETEMRR